ncbi:MAG TPA: MmgE/PrpD family protein [Stellaceae bacterium]|jgi:2-methylcitrate dehydratase PrpD|nr:MmgE/PrpD family protein [Stellaceae bacterium]
MSTARDLAEFFAGLDYADLPAQTTDHAAMLIASTLASAACGREIDSSVVIRDMARERGGNPQASLWFDNGPKLPAAEAAQVNAVMSDAAASDDSDLRAIVHCGTPLTATTLALAERTGASGRDVLAAIVIGYEAAGRIGGPISPDFRDRGHHGSLIAIFAAAVAAGRLLKLDAAKLAQTIALTATSASGLVAAADTSTAREYHAGLAVRSGIDAALAASRGFVAEERILELDKGFFRTYAGIDAKGVAEGLGSDWDIVTDMAVKLVPGGHPYHAFGEAGANAARKGNVKADEVASIIVSRPGLSRLSGPLHPQTLIDMAHSPAYFTAAGVADHKFGWVHASPEKIADPTIHRLIDKVSVGPQPTENLARYRQGATVTIRTTDGREFTDTVFLPTGSGALGIAWSDIEAKYRTLMPNSGLGADRIEASLGLIRDFARTDRVAPLIAQISP